MKIVKLKEVNVGDVVKVLRSGGLVIFPCETVYGAAVDTTNDKAIKKLNDYKKRPLGKPYSIMCASQKMAEIYVELNPTAKKIYKNFLPGPVTIISKGKHLVACGIESETGTLGVRIPDYPFLISLINAFNKPLTATSANASYKRRPYKISDILDNLSDRQKALIDLIIDAGELPHNEPSTVIDTTLDDPVTLRQGGIVVSNQLSVTSRSVEQTQNIGKELWQKYEKYAGQRAIIFALEGEMGAGKTVLTKGLAKAIGIEEEVVSPTFALENTYECKMYNVKCTMSHIDAWRMQNVEELENLGFKKLINDKSVIVIEWADRVAETIRKYNEDAVVVWVNINYPTSPKDFVRGRENERIIKWGVL